MTLSATLASVLLALVVPSKRWAADPDRVPIVADDIALAVGMRGGAPFAGPHATELLALAAAAVAVHESNLAATVLTCEVNGDEGRSVTAFQLMRGVAWGGHTRAELCPSGPLAAYLAVGILQGHAARCARTPIEMFRGYASGSCAKKSDAAERQCRKWVRAAQLAGHDVACEAPFARLPIQHTRGG